MDYLLIIHALILAVLILSVLLSLATIRSLNRLKKKLQKLEDKTNGNNDMLMSPQDALVIKNAALQETLQFLCHIQGRVGEAAFEEIFDTVETALKC